MTKISEPMNDVFGNFESKIDPYFTKSGRQDRKNRYNLLSKDEMRSMLSTTKPISRSRSWATAPLGITSPTRKRP